VALPALVVTIAGYLTVAGTVAVAVSQAVTQADESGQWKEEVKTATIYTPRKK
jgi:hypothetical protein